MQSQGNVIRTAFFCHPLFNPIHMGCHKTVLEVKLVNATRHFGPVYTIPFSFHIALVSYRIGLLFTRYRFHSISDWPPVYPRTHQSDMLHTVFAFSNENALKVA